MSLNLRNEIVMTAQLAEKEFRAHFPAGASYQECFDALRQFADKILEMSKAYEESQAQQPQATAQPATSEAPSASA
jgi:hypothetical protein